MTLSILIPTYNYNARTLVEELSQLSKAEGIDAEIIVGDDASTIETEWMHEVERLNNVRVFHSTTNLGRAAIRNRLGEQALGKWLWFIDSDALVPKNFSLKKGIEQGSVAPVICCGLLHPEVNPNPRATLRYKYERSADKHRSAVERRKHPYRKLSTFSLLINRTLFLQEPFDERCEEYGYEDVLIGMNLAQRHIPIVHIDNPLIHMGIDSNEEFLEKSETAMHTLRKIAHLIPNDGSGISSISKSLSKCHMKWLVKILFKIFKRPIRANLLSSHPSLYLFQFYKLGYYVCL